jgi:hypothetical protein
MVRYRSKSEQNYTVINLQQRQKTLTLISHNLHYYVSTLWQEAQEQSVINVAK